MLRITPDQLTAAGAWIARYYGDIGYAVESIASPTRYVTLFHVVASDGSRFVVLADKWGNCRDVDSASLGDTPEARAAGIAPLVAEMSRHAGAA